MASKRLDLIKWCYVTVEVVPSLRLTTVGVVDSIPSPQAAPASGSLL